MLAVIKSIAIEDHPIDGFVPDDPECFSLNFRIRIGSDEAAGADDFDLCVCTPTWLSRTIWQPKWGRHLLIVREYDRSTIETTICEYVAKCTGGEWRDVAGKLARNFHWEFEDYQE
ncbi:immunity 8 family protein [Paraburkholderia strydomiana]|uniref:immunity 8 family protein n=1 Tax=Paraburkholderia strydomiana TaxID=1245417 RepID=UPI0038BC75C4